MEKKLYEVDFQVSDCMQETLAYFDKQLEAHGITEPPASWQDELFNCCQDSDDVLAALAYLIERGVPVPLINADMRRYDARTYRLAMRAHSAHHRARLIGVEEQVAQPELDVEKANQPSLMPVFRAPALAATL